MRRDRALVLSPLSEGRGGGGLHRGNAPPQEGCSEKCWCAADEGPKQSGRARGCRSVRSYPITFFGAAGYSLATTPSQTIDCIRQIDPSAGTFSKRLPWIGQLTWIDGRFVCKFVCKSFTPPLGESTAQRRKRPGWRQSLIGPHDHCRAWESTPPRSGEGEPERGNSMPDKLLGLLSPPLRFGEGAGGEGLLSQPLQLSSLTDDSIRGERPLPG